MVTEDDLIRTVTAAYSAGWRQVKLYFMCGLPTETDEDVLQIAELAEAGHRRPAARSPARRDIRCTVSIGGFVPKPHTPFQWVGQLDHEATDARLAKLRDAIRSDKRYAKAIGFRYHDGKPGIVEGLLSRGDRRVGKVIEAVYEAGGRFDGWSEHFSFDRWMASAEPALADEPVDVDWYTTRERDYAEVLPVGPPRLRLDRDWLWEDWQDALTGTEVEDCRWTPCFDCGVCPQMGTEIQQGPTGQTLHPAHRAQLGAGPGARREPGRVSGTPDTIHQRGRDAVLAGRELLDVPPGPGVAAVGAVPRRRSPTRRPRRAAGGARRPRPLRSPARAVADRRHRARRTSPSPTSSGPGARSGADDPEVRRHAAHAAPGRRSDRAAALGGHRAGPGRPRRARPRARRSTTHRPRSARRSWPGWAGSARRRPATGGPSGGRRCCTSPLRSPTGPAWSAGWRRARRCRSRWSCGGDRAAVVRYAYDGQRTSPVELAAAALPGVPEGATGGAHA